MGAPKGSGRGTGPPPPAPGTGPPKGKAKPTSKPMEVKRSGMAELLTKVENKGEELDKTNAVEIENVDLDSIDPDAKGKTTICPRCEKEILVTMYESHTNSHSTAILPWLFLGGVQNADNGKELTVRTGITHILNVAHEVNQDHEAFAEWQAYSHEHNKPCKYIKFAWNDAADQDLLGQLADPLRFLNETHKEDNSHRVLVHCVQGISRSASLILCYLMQFEGMSLRQAYEHTRERRPIIAPRREFLDQLGRFECQTFSLEQPSLTSTEVYEGKILLDVDAPVPPG